MNRKKIVKISAILCIFAVAVAGFVGFFALSNEERSEDMSLPSEPIPLVYEKGDEMKIKLKDRESVVVTKLEQSFPGYGNVRIPKNNSGIFYKELAGDVGEVGTLWYSPLSIEGKAQLTKTDKLVDRTQIKSDGSLAVNSGKDLCIFNLEENICIDTDVYTFRVTPDEKKIIYYKNDGKVYTADFSLKAKPELLFDTGEEIDYLASDFRCTPDLSRVLLYNDKGSLFYYRNGKCEKIAEGLCGNYAVPVGDVIYYRKSDGLYCWAEGVEKRIDTVGSIYIRTDGPNIEDFYKQCFKDYKIVCYLRKEGVERKLCFLTGAEETFTVDNSQDIVYDDNNLYALEEDTHKLVRYDITTEGFKNKKEILENVNDLYKPGKDVFVAECENAIYTIIKGECKKISDKNIDGSCSGCGDTLCYKSDKGVLYVSYGKDFEEMGKDVDFYDLREDESIAWITNKGELYVKYKNSEPELADTEVDSLYGINE